MSSDAYSPSTQILEPDITGLPRQYVSTRQVPAEYVAPARGSILGSEWGPTYQGHFIVAATVTPQDGKRIVTIVHCDPGAWVILYGSQTDSKLNCAIGYTTQIVTAAEALAGLGDPLSEYTPINEALSLKRTEIVPTSVLKSFMRTWPCRVDLSDLPRELLAVSVVWNSSYSIGTQDFQFFEAWTGDSGATNKSAGDSASSSASISAEIQLRFRDFSTNRLTGTAKQFFLPNPVTESAILAKLGAKNWPVFKPESLTISTTGQSVSVRANVDLSMSGSWDSDGIQSNGWTKGTSDDFAVSTNNGSVQIPACIHGAITITNGTKKAQSVAATAYMNMTHSILGSISATITKSAVATAEVTPKSIPATAGQKTIPTSGIYLMDSDVSDYRWNYSLVTAVIFNAAKLA